MDDMARLLAAQDGVVARSQLLGVGLSRHGVAGLVRRRRLTALHPGVYVRHTGPPTTTQRQWAAVRACWPAALSHASALPSPPPGVVHVAVDRPRHLRPPDGVVVHRLQGFEGRVRWNLSPPRLRIEDAVLLAASAARDDLGAVAVLTDACGARLTTATRLLDRLAGLGTLPRRRWLDSVLHDVAAGTHSVLEHGYLTRVERPHRLPRGRRQAATGAGRPGWRDVVYEACGVVVELDGRSHHDSPDERARDLQRDLVARAGHGAVTLRLGWQQVFGSACLTARLVSDVLSQRGWPGRSAPCPGCG